MGNQGFIDPKKFELRKESLMTKILLGQQDQAIQHFKSQKLSIQDPLNQTGDTLGHFAAYRGLSKILKYLQTHGDKFDIPNTRNLTALDVALPQVREAILSKKYIYN